MALKSLVVALALAAPPALACGPLSQDPVFAHAQHPDYPLAQFAAGELGVVQPTWDVSYLVAAWRTLEGRPFTPAEQAAVVADWRASIFGGPYAIEAPPPPPPDPYRLWNEKLAAGRARAAEKGCAVPDAPAPPTWRSVPPDGFDSYENCLPDAFATATRTLEDRLGRDVCAAAEWMRGQITVFSNCGEGRRLPDPAPDGAPAWLVQDRAYQRAAALFYGLDFDGARTALDAIAADAASPWRGPAALAAARNEIRRASLAGGSTLEDVRRRLRAVRADASLAEWHASAARLERLARLRQDPPGAMRTLGERLASPATTGAAPPAPSDPAPSDALADFAWLAAKGVRGEDPLSAWIATFHVAEEFGPAESLHATPWTKGEGRFAEAAARWRETKSPAWLVAALTFAPPGEHADLVAAARAVPATSPAYHTAQYHAARLLLATGKSAEARAMLDAALAGDPPPGARNHFAALRLGVATGWAQLFEDALKVQVAATYDVELARTLDADPKAPRRRLFDGPGALTVARAVPAAKLLELAATAPAELRRGLTETAWTRAVLVGDDATARAAARAIGTLDPAFANDLRGWLAEPTPEARRFAGIFLMAKLPGLTWYPDAGDGRWGTPLVERLGVYEGRSWWCALERPAEYYQTTLWESAEKAAAAHPKVYDGLVPPFATPAEAAAIQREWRALAEVGMAPNFFARTFVARAESHPADPRVPEALHRAVYATRHGCKDKGTSEASARAFRTLHRRYPKSAWTQKTPYHY